MALRQLFVLVCVVFALGTCRRGSFSSHQINIAGVSHVANRAGNDEESLAGLEELGEGLSLLDQTDDVGLLDLGGDRARKRSARRRSARRRSARRRSARRRSARRRSARGPPQGQSMNKLDQRISPPPPPPPPPPTPPPTVACQDTKPIAPKSGITRRRRRGFHLMPCKETALNKEVRVNMIRNDPAVAIKSPLCKSCHTHCGHFLEKIHKDGGLCQQFDYQQDFGDCEPRCYELDWNLQLGTDTAKPDPREMKNYACTKSCIVGQQGKWTTPPRDVPNRYGLSQILCQGHKITTCLANPSYDKSCAATDTKECTCRSPQACSEVKCTTEKQMVCDNVCENHGLNAFQSSDRVGKRTWVDPTLNPEKSLKCNPDKCHQSFCSHLSTTF